MGFLFFVQMVMHLMCWLKRTSRQSVINMILVIIFLFNILGRPTILSTVIELQKILIIYTSQIKESKLMMKRITWEKKILNIYYCITFCEKSFCFWRKKSKLFNLYDNHFIKWIYFRVWYESEVGTYSFSKYYILIYIL